MSAVPLAIGLEMTTLIADDTFLDVTIRSKNIFGNIVENSKRLHLPIVWIANKNPSIVNKVTVFLALLGPSGVIPYLAGFRIFGVGVFIVYVPFGIYMIRGYWNLYKIGPGTISVDKYGFSDSKLGPGQILWSSIHEHVVTGDPRDGKPYAVILVSDDAQIASRISVQYKRANMIPLKAKKAVFKLPLQDTENRLEIARAVQTLIEASKIK